MPGSPNNSRTHPFLKWAGGKRQLLEQLESHFPPELESGVLSRYAEPFIGSGAVFFKLFQTYQLRECLIADVNPELILVYQTIQRQVDDLIEQLRKIEDEYLGLGEVERRDFYYQIRDQYNQQRSSLDFATFETAWVERAAYMLFLNRTGYNGLFRVNSKGEFNVPCGRYKNPRILDDKNLRNASAVLNQVSIQYGDFEAVADYVDANTLVYFDPPYRPLSDTAHFTTYSKQAFDDHQQLRLADFYRQLDAKGAKLMLSNSDPHNIDPHDEFFEEAYDGYRIERLQAKRNINRDASKRGPISELLILNY
jgi:DNA adenine methylase